MSTRSKIEWTDTTWNPVSGCTRASAGCDHCYAVGMTHRLDAMGRTKYSGLTVLNANGDRHFSGVVRCDESALPIPMHWKKPRRVFVNSMGDLFHRDVPFDFVDRVFAVMALCPQHTFQILTKRPERMAEYLNRSELPSAGHRIYGVVSEWLDAGDRGFLGRNWDRVHEMAGLYGSGATFDVTEWVMPLPNVWLGTSVEDQATADARIPHLIRCHAAVRFVSIEPLLGEVGLTNLNLGNGDTASKLASQYVLPQNKTVAVRMIGNSVSPPPLESLLRVNLTRRKVGAS